MSGAPTTIQEPTEHQHITSSRPYRKNSPFSPDHEKTVGKQPLRTLCPRRTHRKRRVFRAARASRESREAFAAHPGDPCSSSSGDRRVMKILNFACFKIEKRNGRFSVFCATGQPENRRGFAVRASRGCNGATVAFQQERRCMTTEAPLQPREALTAEPFRQKRLPKTAHSTIN